MFSQVDTIIGEQFKLLVPRDQNNSALLMSIDINYCDGFYLDVDYNITKRFYEFANNLTRKGVLNFWTIPMEKLQYDQVKLE